MTPPWRSGNATLLVLWSHYPVSTKRTWVVERSRRSSRNNAWESSENKGSIWDSTKDNWSLCQIRGWFVKSTNYCLCCPLMEIAVMISKEPHRISLGSTEVVGRKLKSGVIKVSMKPINSALLWILNFLGSFLFHQHFATWCLNIILPSVQRLCCSPLRGCWEMKEWQLGSCWVRFEAQLRGYIGSQCPSPHFQCWDRWGLKPFPGIIWEPCRQEQVTCVPEKEPTPDEDNSPAPSSLYCSTL